MEKIENAGLHTMSNLDKLLVDKVNALIDEVNELKIQLLRVHKDNPDPRNVNPYDIRNRSK